MTPIAPSLSDALSLVAIAFFIGLIPLAAVVITSFLKITVVLGLLRNAMGVQQVPSNMVINGIAIIVSAYIMAPIGMDAIDSMQNKQQSVSSPQRLVETINAVKEPYRVFLKKHAHEKEKQFFLRSAAAVWPPERAKALTELSDAFRVGFLLYMAFVIIDLILANILLALGLSQLSPTTISIPFKLLMFVVMDGWSVLMHGLVLSYK
jgi:type III secretion protein R